MTVRRPVANLKTASTGSPTPPTMTADAENRHAGGAEPIQTAYAV